MDNFFINQIAFQLICERALVLQYIEVICTDALLDKLEQTFVEMGLEMTPVIPSTVFL
jgi:hypothetical protein